MDIIKSPVDRFNTLTGLIGVHLVADIIFGVLGWTLGWSIISFIVTLASTILAFNIYNASIKKLDNKAIKTLFEFVLALLIIHVIVSGITLLVLSRGGSGSQASAKQPNRKVFYLSGVVILILLISQTVLYAQFNILSKL